MPVDLDDALDAAVAVLGGARRDSQHTMATAVAEAMGESRHLLVQAGTGTGKSLAYLVPAVLHAVESDARVIVATATLALQRQLIDNDLPVVVDALTPLLPRPPVVALLKGRQNYLCRNRLEVGGDVADDAEALFESPTSAMGREAVRVRDWADTTLTGERDELDPGVGDRVWRGFSVSGRECLGVGDCPQGDRCFAEAARDQARQADLVVTNHAMLAIDALDGIPLLPEHDVVVVDEAHELVDRVTSVATQELLPATVDRAVARARRHLDGAEAAGLSMAADAFAEQLGAVKEGRIRIADGLFDALVALRDLGMAAIGGLGGGNEDQAGPRKRARAGLEEVTDTAARLLSFADADVVWASRSDRRGPALHVAPLNVAGLLATALFGDRAAVLTSATLTLGGDFRVLAGSLGLPDDGESWQGLDVGSPFDYTRQGVLYVADHLPPPGREVSADALAELVSLIEAAGGRTLGLFSSQRAAEAAAEHVRGRLDVPVLCQGEDTTATLVRRFAADPATCLFGTLSLWQGVDVPGDSCRLVVIDRIPFPRPDDPLIQARQEAAGSRGFMAVSGTVAALRLAQGAGRLIRSGDDRGAVAVLDSRLATARYAGFLLASMPPFWRTTDGEAVRAALRRLDES